MERRNLIGGIILILVGLLMLLSVLDIFHGFNILLFIGAGFLIAYALTKRNIGFLIPGCIVTSIGLFVLLTDNRIISNADGEYFLIMLGCAFLLIMLVHTMWIKVDAWGAKYWPAIPGTILVLIGTFALLDKHSNYNFLETVFKYGWPLIIIAAGLIILIRAFIVTDKNKHNQ